MGKSSLLEVRDLGISFSLYQSGLKKKDLNVIRALDLTVNPGEILAVVGSSGSGKSLLAHSILGILPDNATLTGSISYKGEELTKERQRELDGKEIMFIPQSVDYLDPLMRVGKQVVGVRGTREEMQAAFRRYGLAPEVEKYYPYQLSGGMVRRVLISTAVIGHPELIVADEPTPGLDLKMAEETLKNFRELADQGCGILLITHDLDLALQAATRISVFYAGTIFESAPVSDFQGGGSALRHPYSRALVRALPQTEFEPITGTQPYAGNLPEGCLFGERCPYRTEECGNPVPIRKLRGGEVRCIHAT